MINNKNQFKKALKDNKNGIKLKRIYNLETDNKIKVGSIATISKVQSNACTLIYDTLPNSELWLYYNEKSIEIKDNKIYYFSYFTDDKIKSLRLDSKTLNDNNFIKIDASDSINQNKCTNFLYTYKKASMINEIMEV